MNDNHLQEAEQICFSGAGSMAESIVRGLIHKGVAAPAQIIMHNRSNQERLQYLSEQYGVRTASQDEQKDNDLREASVIVLAMKPKDAAEALRQLGPKLSGNPLIVSVIAGLSISTIQALLGKALPIARTMPNTSSSIGLGATGLSLSDEVSAQQRQTVLSMLQAVGLVSVIPEAQMDILTGVSGSGPAYIYYMMEAMIAAGVEGGLNTEVSILQCSLINLDIIKSRTIHLLQFQTSLPDNANSPKLNTLRMRLLHIFSLVKMNDI